MRVGQLWGWAYVRGVTDFGAMTDIAKDLRGELAESFTLARPEIVTEQVSVDGTRKWLLRLADGKEVETVYIPDEDRGTLCISSQVGCTLTCSFCHTGTQRLVRNLTPAEIVGQIMLARDRIGDWPGAAAEDQRGLPSSERKITNVVLMGMGEPLYNFDHVRDACLVAADGEGLAIGKRRGRLEDGRCGVSVRSLLGRRGRALRPGCRFPRHGDGRHRHYGHQCLPGDFAARPFPETWRTDAVGRLGAAPLSRSSSSGSSSSRWPVGCGRRSRARRPALRPPQNAVLHRANRVHRFRRFLPAFNCAVHFGQPISDQVKDIGDRRPVQLRQCDAIAVLPRRLGCQYPLLLSSLPEEQIGGQLLRVRSRVEFVQGGSSMSASSWRLARSLHDRHYVLQFQHGNRRRLAGFFVGHDHRLHPARRRLGRMEARLSRPTLFWLYGGIAMLIVACTGGSLPIPESIGHLRQNFRNRLLGLYGGITIHQARPSALILDCNLAGRLEGRKPIG